MGAHSPPLSLARASIYTLIWIVCMTAFGITFNHLVDHIHQGSSVSRVHHHPAPHPATAAPPPQRPAQSRPQSPHYTVRAGDSLWSVAARYLGDGSAWPRLYELNRHTIGSDQNLIHVGEVLRL